MSEDNKAGELFGPDVLNDDAIEALSDDVVNELLAIFEKAGY